ncbi:MAG TPA: serine/threonine protein kinase [Burkholderiaceae bacterium]|nr:serine/threonine protein kinase [Burkholderiaceae bacterium]
MNISDAVDPDAPAAPPYADLTPDAVLNAIDALGLVTAGTLLALNSYENRVFQVGLDEPHAGQRFLVAKFYRPQRWSDAQILEEHAFTLELAEREIPVVPPLVIDGRSLHTVAGHRFAVFPRRGGRAPELGLRDVREWLGRYLGRIHAVGATRRFEHRPAFDVLSFGAEPADYLLTHDWLPPELHAVYAGVVKQALEEVRHAFDRAGDVRRIRVHGDVHAGNVLWAEGRDDRGDFTGPYFVDFDDARNGPAVQDLWMLLSGSHAEMSAQLQDLLRGYEEFADFDRRELFLVEALRTLRLIHYAAWIARRWHDPAFPAAFPWFNTPRYWEARVLELREQVAAMQEPPL